MLLGEGAWGLTSGMLRLSPEMLPSLSERVLDVYQTHQPCDSHGRGGSVGSGARAEGVQGHDRPSQERGSPDLPPMYRPRYGLRHVWVQIKGGAGAIRHISNRHEGLGHLQAMPGSSVQTAESHRHGSLHVHPPAVCYVQDISSAPSIDSDGHRGWHFRWAAGGWWVAASTGGCFGSCHVGRVVVQSRFAQCLAI